MGLALGIVLATAVVFWILHPVVAGLEAPMERDDEELTEAQHRKRVALLALRDVEYDFHAGKLGEEDYRSMKREISGEALDALDAEAQEWAVREGRRAAQAATGQGGPDRAAVEAEIEALRDRLREGAVCRECGHPNPRGSRFCGECGGALPEMGIGSAEADSASPGSKPSATSAAGQSESSGSGQTDSRPPDA